MIHLIKHVSDDDPEWLQPLDRAAYPMIAARNRYVSIELDAEARDWLERGRTEAPRRMGRWVLVDVWLSRDEIAGLVQAHIGEQLVGTIRPSDAGEFDDVMRAAALFDEDPFVRGRLTGPDAGLTVSLEIPSPQPASADTAQ